MRAQQGLEQPELCPQPSVCSSPRWAAPGWAPPMLCTAHTAAALLPAANFPVPLWNEHRQMSPCLTHSCLERMAGTLSSLSTSRACAWACDSHITALDLCGFRPFANFSPQDCKDSLPMTLSGKFSNFFCLDPLFSSCSIPSLHAAMSCIFSGLSPL